MILTKDQINELELLSKPLIKYLNDNFNPHVKVTITPTSTEIMQVSVYIPITEYIKD